MKKIIIPLLLCFVNFPLHAQVTPPSVELSLFPGESENINLEVDTSDIPYKMDIVFVIDDTGSMYNEIAAIINGAQDFVNDLAGVADVHYGLEIFNDPTFYNSFQDFGDNTALLLSALSAMSVHGGGDCPEYALSGIGQALAGMPWRDGASRHMFVVTDADAKDPGLLDDTLDGLNAELVQVNSLLYGSCHSTPDATFQDLADGTGGEVASGLVSNDPDDDPLTIMMGMLAANNSQLTLTPTPLGCDPVSVSTNPTSLTLNTGETAAFTETLLASDYIEDPVSCVLDIVNQNGLSVGSQTITVDVLDLEPPELSVPDDFTVETLDSAGIEVSFEVTATDNADPDPLVSCSPASGSLFAVGTTAVSCQAIDDAGNYASDGFNVTVEFIATIDYLDSQVEELDLPEGTEESLLSTLGNAQKSADKGNDKARKNQLNAFKNHVKAQAGKSISEEDAQALLDLADAILDQ